MSKEISATTRALGDTIKTFVTVDGKKTKTAENAFESTLPEGLTMDGIVRYQDHLADVISGATLAYGEVAKDAFTANAELNELSFSMPVGSTSIQVDVHRRKEVPNRVYDKDSGKLGIDGQRTSWGHTSVKVVTQGSKTNAGQLEAVTDYHAAQFEAAFK